MSAFPIKISCERYATIRLAMTPEVIRINVNSPERSIQNANIAMAVIKKLIFNLFSKYKKLTHNPLFSNEQRDTSILAFTI
jgi:hypothetical protein